VLLLDRAEFPRRKPCGECVNPAGVEALRSLGVLAAVEAEGPARLEGWRIRVGEGPGFEGAFPPGRIGLGIPRETLDRILLEHAHACGAEVRTGECVRDLLRDGARAAGVVVDGAEGDREVRARIVVGADGIRSVVLRRLGLLRRPPRLRKVALTAHLRGVEGLGTRGELRVRGDGCFGVAGVGEGICNATVVIAGGRARHVGGDAAGFFDRAVREYGLRGVERTEDVLATGPFDWPVRSAVAPGALLVGDAAGYYDPFTGEGIFRALRGAELAAETIHSALVRGDTSAAALAPYERARRRAFAPGERLQRVIEGFVSRPRALAVVARRLHRRRDLADALIRVTGDLEPVRSLLHPSLLLRLVW
ncbi:MAG TPA: FAD-dependent monooxygenase, partial [Longimicrobiaceae bacterium]|nr:FAD-dependent monooxygenase [Longimicrobiaceae bacterium]